MRQFQQLDITTFESHEKIPMLLRNCDLILPKCSPRKLGSILCGNQLP